MDPPSHIVIAGNELTDKAANEKKKILVTR